MTEKTYFDGLTPRPAAQIEREAKAATARGQTLHEACPYPFISPAGEHFAAVYLTQKPTAQGENPNV